MNTTDIEIEKGIADDRGMGQDEIGQIGNRGTCQRCGCADGFVRLDGYELDLYGRTELVCYCQDCNDDLDRDI